MDWQKLSQALMGLWPIVFALFIAAANWYIQGWVLTNPKPKEKEKEGKRLMKRAQVLLIFGSIVAVIIMVIYEVSVLTPLLAKPQ